MTSLNTEDAAATLKAEEVRVDVTRRRAGGEEGGGRGLAPSGVLVNSVYIGSVARLVGAAPTEAAMLTLMLVMIAVSFAGGWSAWGGLVLAGMAVSAPVLKLGVRLVLSLGIATVVMTVGAAGTGLFAGERSTGLTIPDNMYVAVNRPDFDRRGLGFRGGSREASRDSAPRGSQGGSLDGSLDGSL